MKRFRHHQNSYMTPKHLILLTCLSFFIGSVNAGNLVVNGSFEADPVKWAQQRFDITGWTGFGDTIEIGKANVYGVNGATQTQVVELDAHSASYPTGLYQLIPTTNNAVYNLSIDVAMRSGTQQNTNSIEIWWNGTLVTTIVPTSTTMKTYTMHIKGSGGNDKLELRETEGHDDSLGGMIDNVIVDIIPNQGNSGQTLWRELTIPFTETDPIREQKAAQRAAELAEKKNPQVSP